MHIIKQKAKKLFIIPILFLVMISFFACSEKENPVSPSGTNISGSWGGPFNHPDYYSGYLEMTLVQNNNNISGKYHLYLSPGYSGEDYYGNVTGTSSISGGYNLKLNHTDFTYSCNLSLASDSLLGDWNSSSNKRGTLKIIKQ